jgi:hypothetical protein
MSYQRFSKRLYPGTRCLSPYADFVYFQQAERFSLADLRATHGIFVQVPRNRAATTALVLKNFLGMSRWTKRPNSNKQARVGMMHLRRRLVAIRHIFP